MYCLWCYSKQFLFTSNFTNTLTSLINWTPSCDWMWEWIWSFYQLKANRFVVIVLYQNRLIMAANEWYLSLKKTYTFVFMLYICHPVKYLKTCLIFLVFQLRRVFDQRYLICYPIIWIVLFSDLADWWLYDSFTSGSTRLSQDASPIYWKNVSAAERLESLTCS